MVSLGARRADRAALRYPAEMSLDPRGQRASVSSLNGALPRVANFPGEDGSLIKRPGPIRYWRL